MANMDIGTLKSRVRAALSAGGDFSLVLPDLDAPALTALAGAALPNSTLSLTGATVEEPEDDQRITILGTGKDLPFTGLTCAAEFSAPGGVPTLRMTAHGDRTWLLSTGFPPFSTALAGEIRFLDSPPPTLYLYSDPQDGGPPAGLSLEATLDFNTMTGGLSSLIGRETQPIHGSFVLQQQGSELAGFSLSGDAATGVNLGVADDLTVSFGIGGWIGTSPLDGATYILPYLTLGANIPFSARGASHALPVTLIIFDLQGNFRFQTDLTGLLDATLDEIKALTCKMGFEDKVPQGDFHLQDYVSLSNFFFDINPTALRPLTQIGVDVQNAHPWTIVHLEDSAKDWVLQTVLLAFRIVDPTGPAPNLALLASGELSIGAAGVLLVSTRYPDWDFDLSLKPGTTLNLTEAIAEFMGNTADAPALVVNTLELHIAGDDYLLALDLQDDWTVADGIFSISEVGFSVDHHAGAGTAASIQAVVEIANVGIAITADHPGDPAVGWQFQGQTDPSDVIAIGTLLADLAARFNLTLPEALQSLQLAGLEVDYNTATGRFHFTCSGGMALADGQPQSLQASVDLTVEPNAAPATGYHSSTSGVLVVTLANGVKESFGLAFDSTPGSKLLTATWQETGHPLSFADLAGALGFTLPGDVPPSLDLALMSAAFVYDFAQGSLVLTAASQNYGTATFVSIVDTQTQQRVYVLSLDVADIDLAGLPLVGGMISTEHTLGLRKIQVLIASVILDAQTVSTINLMFTQLSARLRQGPTALPTDGVPSGSTLRALVSPGDMADAVPLALALAPTASPQPPPPGVTAPGVAKWITLQKAFGPVYVDRVGLQYQDGTLLFLLDATLTLAGLTLSLDGLGFGAALSDFHPTFTLRGLGLQYASGPVAISGSFLGYTKMVDGHAIVEYDGGALIKTEALTLSAFGSYTDYAGHPSLFIYAVLDYPLGGPAFFYVTGLTAGFGYNRALNLPPIEQVAQFPLITAAVGQPAPVAPANANNTQAMMAQLAQANAVPPSVGTDFFALGVKFTSFKLVDSFALLTVAFGTQVEIGLLGLATLIAPVPEAAKAVPPLAEVQMAIKASFIPAQGFLGLAAQLTPASFILARACHLTGGYAFYAWFAPSPHDGDFVQTLGGYHPRFAPPPHYPVVPRVGVNWQVTPQLTLKGSAYFALTASLLMAGGAYQITWESGNFKAWYNFAADFLVGWKPFHYDAAARVDIGASYTFRSKILGTHRISVDVGADMHVWGPEFSGQAHVDLHIISFDIAFGAGAAAKPAAIAWTGDDTSFTRSFLPDAGVCSVTITGGLIDTASVRDPQTNARDTIWLVNPKDLRLVTNSLIPAKEAYRKVADGGDPSDFVALQHNGSTTFGVAPMDVHSGDLNTTHSLAITRAGALVSEDFQYTPILKQVPMALWGESMTPALNGPAFVQTTLAGFTVTPAQPPAPGVTVQVDQAVLAGAPQTVPGAYGWTDHVPAFTPDTQDDATRRQTIADDLISAAPIREAILQALGIDPGQVRLNPGLAEVFVIPPEIPA